MSSAAPLTAALEKYLHTYGETTPPCPFTRQYKCALIVPLFDEDPTALEKICQHQATDQNVLVIAVVNAPDNASTAARQRTKALLTQAQNHCPLDCWIIDAVTQPLPAKQGVGMARKIGNDAALQLWLQGQLESPWLYQTDADAILPSNYFSTPLPLRGAVVFAHQHCSTEPLLAAAANLYDGHMQHYVDGLTRAGSSYAYPTLGSTMALHLQDYCLVRGFPKRSAAEDFYLLNKIAKVHAVKFETTVTVQLEARLSHRVPFGTGPALVKILEGLRADPSGAFYHSYNPQSFSLLGTALQHLQTLSTSGVLATDSAGNYLRQLGIARLSSDLHKKYPRRTQRHKMLTQWFDAGKTLRFIHLAREHYPDLPLQQIHTGKA
jgi:hypothetical protein